MRVLRGGFFNAPDVVACFLETPGGGDIKDINAPRNAPAKTPSAYLDRIAFHSHFYGYELAMPMQTVNVNHPAIVTATTTWAAHDPQASVLSVNILGQRVEGQRTLLAHGLPYTPLVMVAYQDVMVVTGTIVQQASNRTRFVSVFADSTIVGLGELGYSSDVDLPAVTRTYKVLVFRTPAPNPALPLFAGTAASFQLGRGMVNSQEQYLRRDNSLSAFDIDFERTIDVDNGGARIVTGGNVQSDPWYGGSFAGGSYQPVGV